MYYWRVNNSTHWLEKAESTNRLVTSVTTLVTKSFLEQPHKILVSAEKVEVVVKLH